jgi:chemosensory pili system protein ChpA (sensor histidine kinase/response regulator)
VRGQVVPVIDPALGPAGRRTRRGSLRAGDPLVLVEAAGVRAALCVDRIIEGEPSRPTRALDPAELFASLRQSVPGATAQLPSSEPPRVPTATQPLARPAPALSDADLSELRAFFFDEAAEHLDAVDDGLARLEHNPGDADALSLLLRELHTLKGSAGAVSLHELSQLVHHVEDLALALRSSPDADGIAALVSWIEHLHAQVSRGGRPVTGPFPLIDAPVEDAPLVEPQGERRSDESAQIRVEVERVDALMEAVGQLVLDRTRIARQLQEVEECLRELGQVQAALLSLAETGGDPERLGEAEARLRSTLFRLGGASAGLGAGGAGLRATSQVLQEGLQRMRMMEVGRLFARLAGPVREQARRWGREVEVHTAGVATAIDKAVVERIAEPLLHLVRNAVAHGIEPAEARVARGKPRVGRLELSARQRGDQIIIEVADDGGGIDLEGVRRALMRQGGFTAEQAAALDDAAVVNAIFQPGVSTRVGADDLAGRGVGLDAVKDSITRLGGVITCASVAGRGTRFTVRLPLTTAIVRALLFKVNGQVYAVPAGSVVATTRLSPEQQEAPSAAPFGETVPLLRLHQLLALVPPPGRDLSGPHRLPSPRDLDADAPAALLDHDGFRFLATCDKLIGEREIVIKNLGPLLGSLALFAGATISGAGKVQLVLDVAELAARADPAGGAGRLRGVPSVEPAARATQEQGREASAGEAAGAAEPTHRVLVVDDSRSARETAARILLRGGYHVDAAVDGGEAWALLAERRYDVVVTDLEMPGTDGYALLALLRRDPDKARLPVVVISSQQGDARTRALDGGARAFLNKPVPPSVLLETVARVI